MKQICRSDNLSEAFLRAAKGKACKKEVIGFRQNLGTELADIACELWNGSYRFAPYREFTIYDPKRRTICAASFRDRVAFHAMMRVCHDIFDNYQISDSYASRVGKGVYAALDKAKLYCRRNLWFAKMDVVKYFDSIDQQVLMGQLCRLFKDKELLILFRRLLDTYETSCGCGLPIGNLTSQYFANHYLAVADHFCKEYLKVKCMVRYMDDIVFFSDDKKQLLEWCSEYRGFLDRYLKLSIHPVTLNRTLSGLPFLGYVVYPDCLRLNQNSRRRFRRKMKILKDDLLHGAVGQQDYADRVTALYAFIDKADVKGFKRNAQNNGLFP